MVSLQENAKLSVYVIRETVCRRYKSGKWSTAVPNIEGPAGSIKIRPLAEEIAIAVTKVAALTIQHYSMYRNSSIGQYRWRLLGCARAQCSTAQTSTKDLQMASVF